MAYTPKYSKKQKKTRGTWIFDLIGAVSLCLLLLGGGMFLRDRLQSKADQDAFQSLAARVEQVILPTRAPGADSAGLPQTGTQPREEAEAATTPYYVLKEENPDFAAWLTVPGTNIDYPVMHTPEDIEYYIYRSFEKEESPSGTPFVGDYGSLEENRCVIYGHNMNDGTMFRDLELYGEQEFWQENNVFYVTTLTEVRKYEIFSAVRTRLLYPEETGLRYYRLEDGIEQWLTDKALYDTGITAKEGDEIVILSTCTYHTENGRFIIAGKRVE